MASRSELYFWPEIGCKGMQIVVAEKGHVLIEDFMLPARTLDELHARLQEPASIATCYANYYSWRFTDWMAFKLTRLAIYSVAGDFFADIEGTVDWEGEKRDDGVTAVVYHRHRLQPV